MWLEHRRAWTEANGPIPDGMFVLHHCDNRACSNVEHLFLGTQTDNMRDMLAKGRGSRVGPRGEAHGHAKLTEAQVREIRDRYAAKGVTHDRLAKDYGVSSELIGLIVRRKIWKHVH
jgi:hypothetical protein